MVGQGRACFSLFFIFGTMKRVAFLLLFPVFFPGFRAAAQLTPAGERAYELVLRMRFDEAMAVLDGNHETGDPHIPPYLKHYTGFLKVLISEEKEMYKSFSSERKQLLREMESGREDSPWHLYAGAMARMQWAFAAMKFGEYSSAGIDLNTAYRMMQRNAELFPDFAPAQTAIGLMKILIGSVPDNYRWITRLLSMQGSVSEGTEILRRMATSASVNAQYPFLKSETLFLLSFVTFNLSGSESDRNLTAELITQNRRLIEESPLLIYAAAVFYMHYGENEKALRHLMNRPAGKNYYPFHYLDYLTGQAKLNRLDFDAEVWFLRYVTGFRGSSFIKSAYQRLAWIELLKDNEKGYHDYLFRAKHRGGSLIDGDKQALAEAEGGPSAKPDPGLLKARLLFDGGYYSRALEILTNPGSVNLSDEKQQLEYHYRLARIYHLSGNEAKAIAEYQTVVESGQAQPWYFAANSALNLGLIYEQKSDLRQAEYYYRKCLSLKYTEYRTGISQKARAGLSRIR